MASAPDAGNFDIGRAFGTAFRAVFANFLIYLGLGAVFLGVPIVVFATSLTGFVAQSMSGNDPLTVGLLGTVALGGILLLVGTVMLQAALVRATVEYLNDRTPNFGDCIQVGLRAFLPLIGIGLIVGLGVAFGLLLLIIPGIILWVMWSVAVPVHVEERAGVFDSLNRSRALTKGSRWAIFGLIVAMTIVNWVMQVALQTIGGIGGEISGATLGMVGSLIGSLFTSALTAAIYVELRTTKEGANVSELAAIFN
ncbi:MAG: hypothetical protein ACKVOP_07405 [Sphingomonadaceae bacterium]